MPEVERVAVKRVNLFAGSQFIEFHFCQRNLFTNERQQARQNADGRRTDKADTQRSYVAQFRRARRLRRQFRIFQNLSGAFIKRAPRRCEFDFVLIACQQLDAEFFFELLDLLAERGLRQMQHFSRTAKVQLFGDRDKIFEMA